MRVPLDGDGVRDFEQDSSPVADPPLASAHPMRLWLVSGVHSLAVDRRRRIGRHGLVRRLLMADGIGAGIEGRWRELVSALQRHTVHSGLESLGALERQVVTLAFLEGLTNREIAERLGMSVTAVRRRLWMGLQKLEEYLVRSGTLMASVLLLALAVVSRWARSAKLTEAVRTTDWLQPVTATVATGVAAAAVVGLMVTESPASSAEVGRPAQPAPATIQSHSVVSGESGVTTSSTGAVKSSEEQPAADDRTIEARDTDRSHVNHGQHRQLGRAKVK